MDSVCMLYPETLHEPNGFRGERQPYSPYSVRECPPWPVALFCLRACLCIDDPNACTANIYAFEPFISVFFFYLGICVRHILHNLLHNRLLLRSW